MGWQCKSFNKKPVKPEEKPVCVEPVIEKPAQKEPKAKKPLEKGGKK